MDAGEYESTACLMKRYGMPQSTRHRGEEHPGARVEPLERGGHGASDRAAALEGAAERHLVGVLEVAADGEPRGEARDA